MYKLSTSVKFAAVAAVLAAVAIAPAAAGDTTTQTEFAAVAGFEAQAMTNQEMSDTRGSGGWSLVTSSAATKDTHIGMEPLYVGEMYHYCGLQKC